jgi:hypothetical protein
MTTRHAPASCTSSERRRGRGQKQKNWTVVVTHVTGGDDSMRTVANLPHRAADDRSASAQGSHGSTGAPRRASPRRQGRALAPLLSDRRRTPWARQVPWRCFASPIARGNEHAERGDTSVACDDNDAAREKRAQAVILKGRLDRECRLPSSRRARPVAGQLGGATERAADPQERRPRAEGRLWWRD